MASLGEVLDLFQTARHSFRTLEATVRQEHHRSPTPPAAGADDRPGSSYPGPANQEHGLRTAVSRLWVERPRRLRQEDLIVSEGAKPSTVVMDGDHWWSSAPGHGVSSNDGDPMRQMVPGLTQLIAPMGAFSQTELSVLGHVTVAGRPGIALRATPRTRPRCAVSWHLRGVDHLEAVVDAERGVLLRLVHTAAGERRQAQEVVGVTYDPILPENLFLPLLGEEPLQGGRPVRVDLELAASLVPFTVLVPTLVPAGTAMLVSFVPQTGTEPQPSLEIRYSFPSAAHSLVVVEGGPAVRSIAGPGWDKVERDGAEILVGTNEHITGAGARSAEGRWYRLLLERSGTHVLVQSDLSLEALLAIVSSLRPARTPSS